MGNARSQCHFVEVSTVEKYSVNKRLGEEKSGSVHLINGILFEGNVNDFTAVH
jgi:sRNA-binding regulator protein Hfq